MFQRFVRRSFEWRKLLKHANNQSHEERQKLTQIISSFSKRNFVPRHALAREGESRNFGIPNWATPLEDRSSLNLKENGWSSRFSGAFAKLRKATTNFIMSVRLSVHLSTWKKRLTINRFSWNFIFEYFSKTCRHFFLGPCIFIIEDKNKPTKCTN